MGSPMHISEHGTGVAEGFEPSEPVAHGDGPGRTFRGVPFPATETSDDPACPGQGTDGMRVLLLGGTPFKTGLLEAEGFDLVGGEDFLGGDWGGAVAGVDELHDAGRGKGGKKGEFAQAVGGLDLTGLDIEALALEGPEQLLDVPALAIPFEICWASAAVLTTCVVSKRQCSGGSGPELGAHSRTSTTLRATLSGNGARCWRSQRGHISSTLPKRSSSCVRRAGRPGC